MKGMKSNAWSAETLVRGARALDNQPSAWRASIESDKDLENAKLETCQKQGFHTDIFLIWVGSFVLHRVWFPNFEPHRKDTKSICWLAFFFRRVQFS